MEQTDVQVTNQPTCLEWVMPIKLLSLLKRVCSCKQFSLHLSQQVLQSLRSSKSKASDRLNKELGEAWLQSRR